MHKKSLFIAVLVLAFLGLIVLPQEWASATIPPPAPCDVSLTSGQNIQVVVDLGGPKTICLQGTFKQSVIIGPEDTASGYITIQGVSPGGIMDGQNGVGTPDPGTSYSSGMDAFELLPGVSNVTIRDLEIKDYKDPLGGTGTGNAIQAWGPYVPGVATSNVNVWNNNMHGFSWNGILVGNSGTGLHSNWSVIGNTIEPCWIGIELTNTNDSVVEDNTVSGGGCFTPPDDWVIGIMLQARNIAAEGGSGSLTMSNVSVQGNTIVALGPATLEYGIYLLAYADGPTATLSNIKVGGSGNQIENNSKYGVLLYGAGGTVDSVSIMDNDILNNDTGIRLAGTSTNVKANLNNIAGNTTWGARNTAAAELDATNNWWGSSSGPTHVGNLGGTGDAVSDNVKYRPWLVVWPLPWYWKDYNGEDPGGYMPDIDQNQDFDKVEVRTEQTDPAVTLNGTWGTTTDSKASGGNLKYTMDPNATCTFSFNGSSIKWIGAKAYNRGRADVYIDGQLDATVNQYDPIILWQQVIYSNTNLISGPHTIMIKPIDAPGKYIDVDAFDVDDIEKEYCAPVAEANSLWWLDKKYANIEIFSTPLEGTGYIGGDINQDGNSDILDLVQELAIMMKTNQGHTGTTVLDEQDGIDTFLKKYGLNSKLYEHTIYSADFPNWLPYFAYIEEEVERSQDVKLDLGFWHVDRVEGQLGNWQVWWSRRGGHAVTVAGVDSQNLLLAISDPDNDAAENGGLGVIRPVPGGHPLHPNDPTVHNNEMFASHDIYTAGPSPSPGGKMGLLNFPWKWNLPEGEWETVGPVLVEWTEPLYESMTFTEVEAAVIVSPIICGNGVVDPGEQCDDGNANNNDTCLNNCTSASCGDGFVGPGEECDDGNLTSEDGCSATCQLEVVVTQPNGGEVVPSGKVYAIKWLALPAVKKFDLEYSMNNGGTWTAIASKVTGSSYDWTVPKPLKNKKNCLVKVKGYDASNVLVDDDTSDAKFTIEVVKVTSPDGGENWKAGTTHAITWTTNGTKRPVKKVKLFYTYNGGTNWMLIYTILTGNPGTYNWRVPSANSANCKVKVVLKDKLGTTMGTDMSDSTFAISP